MVSYVQQQATDGASIWDTASNIARRHENFLKRDNPNDKKKPSSWRPRKMFRATSAKVLQMVSKQVCNLAVVLVW